MSHETASPLDGTPPSRLRRTILVVLAGYAIAFALNPGSAERWGYMLNDTSAVRPVQLAAEAVSDAGMRPWHLVGSRSPYELLREVSQAGRLMIGASD